MERRGLESPEKGAERTHSHLRGVHKVSFMFVESIGLTPSSFFAMKTGKRVVKSKISTCDLEFVVQSPRNLEPQQIDAIPPFLTCNFDIEVFSKSGKFPDATLPDDAVKIIGLDFWRVGQPMESAVSVMLVFGQCDPIDGCVVLCFDSEKKVQRFRDLIAVYANPDFVYGYNRFGFDDKYLEDRAVARRRPLLLQRPPTHSQDSFQGENLESEAWRRTRCFPSRGKDAST